MLVEKFCDFIDLPRLLWPAYKLHWVKRSYCCQRSPTSFTFYTNILFEICCCLTIFLVEIKDNGKFARCIHYLITLNYHSRDRQKVTRIPIQRANPFVRRRRLTELTISEVSSFVCDKTQTTTVVNCRSGTLKLARVATSRFLGAFRYRPVDWSSA